MESVNKIESIRIQHFCHFRSISARNVREFRKNQKALAISFGCVHHFFCHNMLTYVFHYCDLWKGTMSKMCERTSARAIKNARQRCWRYCEMCRGNKTLHVFHLMCSVDMAFRMVTHTLCVLSIWQHTNTSLAWSPYGHLLYNNFQSLVVRFVYNMCGLKVYLCAA